MKIFLKLFVSGIALLTVSWWLAYFWMLHGGWWLNNCSKFCFEIVYILAKPILSAEVWEAEEQLVFLGFWVPSFVVTVLIMFLFNFAKKFISGRRINSTVAGKG